MTLVFAMAVPAGWVDETRRYVEDRISVNLQACRSRTSNMSRTLVQDAVQLSEGVPRHSSPGDERQGGPGRAFDDAERGHDQRPKLRALMTHIPGSRDWNLHRHRLLQLPNWSSGTTTRRDKHRLQEGVEECGETSGRRMDLLTKIGSAT